MLQHCLSCSARGLRWNQLSRRPGSAASTCCMQLTSCRAYVLTNTVHCCAAIHHDCAASALLLKYELYFSAPTTPVLRHPTPTMPPQFCATPIDPLQIVLLTRNIQYTTILSGEHRCERITSLGLSGPRCHPQPRPTSFLKWSHTPIWSKMVPSTNIPLQHLRLLFLRFPITLSPLHPFLHFSSPSFSIKLSSHSRKVVSIKPLFS